VTRDEKPGKILGVALTDDGNYDELAESQIAINDCRKYFCARKFDFCTLQFSASPEGTDWRDIGPVLIFQKLADDYGGTAFHRRAGRIVRAGCRRY
jgi:xylan 1,4-beta-xylosidase